MNDDQAQEREYREFSVEEATSNAKVLLQNIAVSLPYSNAEDGDLLRSCVEFAETFQKWEPLFTDPNPFATDAQRDEITVPMLDFQIEQLRIISNMRATTLRGHCARAAVILLFDLGAILQRANNRDMIHKSLLAALLVDLVTTWEVLPSLAGKPTRRSVIPKKRVVQSK